MFYKLSTAQEEELLNLPETGMGYQIIGARKRGSYSWETFLILNSEIVIEMDGSEAIILRNIIDEGILTVKDNASIITFFNKIMVFNESQFRDFVSGPKNENEKGAIENSVENADGYEIFVRLSAFNNDRRVDKINKCLRPGSFTTTLHDYGLCKFSNLDPIQRYALPANDKIKFAFHIQPVTTDTLQRGVVQPANGKPGGGKEAYFAKGTALNTFLKQTPY